MVAMSRDLLGTLPQRSGLGIETVSLTQGPLDGKAGEKSEESVEWGTAHYAVGETDPDMRPRILRVDRFQLTCLVSTQNGIKSDFRCTNFVNVLQKMVVPPGYDKPEWQRTSMRRSAEHESRVEETFADKL